MRSFGTVALVLAIAAAWIVGQIRGTGDVPVGGEFFSGVEGQRFPGGGPLIGDQDLLHDAVDAWEGPHEYTRALWAGPTNSLRTVVLQRGTEFKAVTLGAGEPMVTPARLRANRFL